MNGLKRIIWFFILNVFLGYGQVTTKIKEKIKDSQDKEGTIIFKVATSVDLKEQLDKLKKSNDFYDKRKKVYDYVIDSQYFTSFDDFYKKIESPEKRKKIYDLILEKYDIGTFEDFSSDLGYLKNSDISGVFITDLKYHWLNVDRGIEVTEGGYGGSLLHGKLFIYGAKGNLETEEEYFCGIKNGESKKWDNQGNLIEIAVYRNGYLTNRKFKEDEKWVESPLSFEIDKGSKRMFLKKNNQKPQENKSQLPYYLLTFIGAIALATYFYFRKKR
ncbi:hypothetical protein [Capnocytophaga canis]|uniref:hypothetical protein n=1 Tax=Capnocytophaga canis TaxID=1848903 RepID=UPI0037D8A660